MEYIIFGILFAPFIMVAFYITTTVLLKCVMVLWADAFSAMGWDAPKKYLEYHLDF